MAYTKKDGSMSFPQSIKDLAEYLSVNCNSTLEVHYTQGKDANAYAKEMFNEYKTSQKYKSTYKSTIPMDMMIRDLESKEKTNGNKPLTVGSDLYKAFIDQATKTMRQYVDYFPKVYSGYILEITVSSCNYKDKLKSTLDDLVKKGAVKKVFYQDKITYLHCADSYAIGRILKDIPAKEVKTPIVAKPTTTTTTSSNFVPYINTSKIVNTEDYPIYTQFKSYIDSFLIYLSKNYKSSITITDIKRTAEEQAYLMVGAMNPDRSKYDGDIYKLGENKNYITIYNQSKLYSIIDFAFINYTEDLSHFERDNIKELVKHYKDYQRYIYDKKHNPPVSPLEIEDQNELGSFFTTLADTIIGNQKLVKDAITLEYKRTSTFKKFVGWVGKNEFPHLFQTSKKTAVDFTIDRFNKEINDKQSLQNQLNKIKKSIDEDNTIKRRYNLEQIISEDVHLHIVIVKP